jgi:hypothetical protein
MKANFFTYAEKPKAVYFLSKIKNELYPNHSMDDFHKEIHEKWVKNSDVVLIDDRENSYTSESFEMEKIEKYLDKLEELKKEFNIDDDEEKA